MKKQYITPETQAVKVQTSCLLAASDPALNNFDPSINEDSEVTDAEYIL